VSSIADKDGGLWVLGAPAGCGKSTYLQCAIDKFRQENKDRNVFILMGIENFKDQGIHKALSIPQNSDLSTYLPEGTVIIIDQIDSKVDRIDATMEDYIIKLAAESRNKRVFSLLVSVNDSSVMLKILHMNQGEKIKDVCKPECIQWTQAQASKFIENAFKELSLSEKNKVLRASNIYNEHFVPGMIWTASKDYHSGYKIDTVLENMKSIQISKKAEWGKYGDNLKDYRFNRTKIE
jgi:ABC-type cobalamin/Fe3+-siderophores transport system ATPase subunit